MGTAIYDAILTLRHVFIQYAKKEGSEFSLSKGELADVLREQLCMEAKGKEVEEYLHGLDGNKDDVIDFKEYMTAIVALSVMMFTVETFES
ncbi:protein S100-A6-like [Symphorus nematophorus]